MPRSPVWQIIRFMTRNLHVRESTIVSYHLHDNSIWCMINSMRMQSLRDVKYQFTWNLTGGSSCHASPPPEQELKWNKNRLPTSVEVLVSSISRKIPWQFLRHNNLNLHILFHWTWIFLEKNNNLHGKIYILHLKLRFIQYCTSCISCDSSGNKRGNIACWSILVYGFSLYFHLILYLVK